ncbi:MAG TPA: hypothetical protein VGR84_18790 [Candidatus Acidoferrales bacterium]|nr:hypothetical protein [Candidatus Acidoferrales bacterium]
MSNDIIHADMPFQDMMRLAESIAKSRLFGIQNQDQALVLMAISQAEGRHPALAARDYDIIGGRPSKKAEAMLRDFLAAGGKVTWHQLDDTMADATFSHPQGGERRISWDLARAKKAGLSGKEMWAKYTRQMLRSRCVSDGVRTVCPAATSGFYVPEEIADMKDVTPANASEPRAEGAILYGALPQNKNDTSPAAVLVIAGKAKAAEGVEQWRKWWKSLSKSNRALLNTDPKAIAEMQAIAEKADAYAAKAQQDGIEELIDDGSGVGAYGEIPSEGSEIAPSADPDTDGDQTLGEPEIEDDGPEFLALGIVRQGEIKAGRGPAALAAWWKALKPGERRYLGQQTYDRWAASAAGE